MRYQPLKQGTDFVTAQHRPEEIVRMKRNPLVTANSSLVVSICILTLACSALAAGSQYKTIYTFLGDSDGYIPSSRLIADQSDNLYGTTQQGGMVSKSSNCYPQGCGTVFQLNPPAHKGDAWKKTILYSFNLTDGNSPTGLVFDQSGNLFGITLSGGGASNPGLVFELMPPKKKGGAWTESTIYTFTGGNDGQTPNGLIFDSAGNLYGTTQNGGQYGQQGSGTVFELTNKGGVWSETTLYSFMLAKDGDHPSDLVFDDKGNLYGTTTGDDVSCGPKDPINCGWAFELEAPSQQGGAWTYQQIHSFQGYNDGSFPSIGAMTFDQSGNLYGMTVGTGGTGNIPVQNAEGTIFKLAPPVAQGDPWKETLLYSFPRPGGIDGSGPEGGVIFDQVGNLYGTTLYGAGNARICAYRGCGSVFQLKPPTTKGGAGKENQLHGFTGGSDGSSPASGVMLSKGKIFGTAAFGGGSGCGGGGCGTIFEVAP
jgi:uncharacterized repeat protein (TIGR03803 family)